MSKEASRARRIMSRLPDRGDVEEIVKMAKIEVVRGLACRELPRYDRGVAIYEAGLEALDETGVRVQPPRYMRAA